MVRPRGDGLRPTTLHLRGDHHIAKGIPLGITVEYSSSEWTSFFLWAIFEQRAYLVYLNHKQVKINI